MIPLTRPYVDEREADAVAAVLDSGQLVQGSNVIEFERRCAAAAAAKFGVAVTSATAGLFLALSALGVGSGDEVLVPSFTFPATGNVVAHLGARPVLVDVLLDDYSIDVDDARHRVSSRTRAAVPVDPFGLPHNADGMRGLADEFGIALIEDAACSIGSTYRGRPAGTLGDVGVFSFHGRKVITTGEGGMIVTDLPEVASRVALLRNHGGERAGTALSFVEAGYNLRMSDIAGAIGVAQMEKLDEIITARRAAAANLTAALTGVDAFTPQTVPDDRTHAYQSYVGILDAKIDRGRFIECMRARGVEATIGTYALHLEPYFIHSGLAPEDLPHARKLGLHAVTLPLFPGITDYEIQQVAETVTSVIDEVG